MNLAYSSKAAARRTALPIGIFDSGVGGLTVVRQIHRVLPNEDLIYLGDTARVPYGNKSPGTVIRYSCEDTRFLLERNVKPLQPSDSPPRWQGGCPSRRPPPFQPRCG